MEQPTATSSSQSTESRPPSSPATSSTATTPKIHFRIGSRESQLALIQTNTVRDLLKKVCPQYTWKIETRKTMGDKILDVALAKIGDKGLFTKELEIGMLHGELDLAVHSLKDLPTTLPEGLMIGAILKREIAADALVVNEKNLQFKGLAELPPGSVIGSSSLRRKSQLLRRYPHLVFKDVRGNLNTRLRKLDEGEYDGLILAVAGLQRLGVGHRIHQVLGPDESLHAVGQGALAVECRKDDPDLLPLLEKIHDPETALCCRAERSFLRELEGGCQVPVGVNSTFLAGEGGEGEGEAKILLRGAVLSVDGQQAVEGHATGPANDPETLGIQLAKDLKARGANEILQAIFASARQ
jgi:hydroxymethylbilane synthase